MLAYIYTIHGSYGYGLNLDKLTKQMQFRFMFLTIGPTSSAWNDGCPSVEAFCKHFVLNSSGTAGPRPKHTRVQGIRCQRVLIEPIYKTL